MHDLSKDNDDGHVDNINFSQEKLPVVDNGNYNHEVNTTNAYND